MAQRWSFKEEYIICKYCVEQEGCHRIYNPICVNIELAENGVEELFVEQ